MAALAARSRDPAGRRPGAQRASGARLGVPGLGGSGMIARAGLVLAVLQFGFALTWVVYATFLPTLAAQVGIARSMVPWILLADQAIFLVCDWLAGVFADRAAEAVVRLGRMIALITLVSCAAFLALPLVA